MNPTALRDFASLARYILSSDCQSIAFLTGAGVSVASGIPDFRSPGGMYDTLRPERITATPQQRHSMRCDPTEVVMWDLFQQTSLPYLEVRRPFILGTYHHQWKATIAHRFMELLHTKTATTTKSTAPSNSKLTRIYTQNIDGLDQQCSDIPKSKIVNVHGTISEASCEGCGALMPDFGKFCRQVQTQIKDIYDMDAAAPAESKPIVCPKCNAPLVKPTTVLFGRMLPDEFFHCVQEDLPTLDLLIVAGTSLVVSPANSVVHHVPSTCHRVVVNLEPVGEELGIVYPSTSPGGSDSSTHEGRDLFLRGTCDQIFLELIVELGWLEDLHAKIADLPDASARLVQEAMKHHCPKKDEPK